MNPNISSVLSLTAVNGDPEARYHRKQYSFRCRSFSRNSSGRGIILSLQSDSSTTPSTEGTYYRRVSSAKPGVLNQPPSSIVFRLLCVSPNLETLQVWRSYLFLSDSVSHSMHSQTWAELKHLVSVRPKLHLRTILVGILSFWFSSLSSDSFDYPYGGCASPGGFASLSQDLGSRKLSRFIFGRVCLCCVVSFVAIFGFRLSVVLMS